MYVQGAIKRHIAANVSIVMNEKKMTTKGKRRLRSREPQNARDKTFIVIPEAGYYSGNGCFMGPLDAQTCSQ